MSDRIQELIDGIKEKASSLHGQLSTERSSNQELQDEVSSLKNEVSSKEEEIIGLKSKISELETKLETKDERDVNVSEDAGVSEEQIDELVKEIEYCIEQLKK
jgi:chromosome segregation ATPase